MKEKPENTIEIVKEVLEKLGVGASPYTLHHDLLRTLYDGLSRSDVASSHPHDEGEVYAISLQQLSLMDLDIETLVRVKPIYDFGVSLVKEILDS